ncbi:MAG: hypothetical protein OCD02_04265 [Spirochaetaceae bacterium]
MKKLVIVGNGKLADSIANNISDYTDINIERYNNSGVFDNNSIFVHIGSGREFEESLKLAIQYDSSYIQSSTENKYKLEPPQNISIKYIHAPNLDINIIKLIYWLKLGKDLFKNEQISIFESHQTGKKSKPGTAIKFAQYLGLNEDDIISIRNKNEQEKLNIKNLNHHAYHKIRIGDLDSSIEIETKIEGAISYSKGLAKIVSCFENLQPGNYEIEELVEMNLL